MRRCLQSLLEFGKSIVVWIDDVINCMTPSSCVWRHHVYDLHHHCSVSHVIRFNVFIALWNVTPHRDSVTNHVTYQRDAWIFDVAYDCHVTLWRPAWRKTSRRHEQWCHDVTNRDVMTSSIVTWHESHRALWRHVYHCDVMSLWRHVTNYRLSHECMMTSEAKTY